MQQQTLRITFSTLIISTLFFACHESQQISPTSVDSLRSQTVSVNFFDLNIKRDPLPLPNFDSLAKINFTVSDYLQKSKLIDQEINRIQSDTTLPIDKKNAEITKREQ